MRLAFIGGSGHAILRRLLANPVSDIERPVAVASDGYDTPKAKDMAAGIGQRTWFNNYEQMLDEYKPDVVNVGAVYGFNGDVIAKVLERGIPVVSDKPIAATWEQMATLEKLALMGKGRIITEFEFRCRPEVRSAKAAVAAGEIGTVIMATAQKSYRFGDSRPAWYGDRVMYGGTILWVASHGIDVIHYITGKKFARVTGQHGNLSHPELPGMEDHCVSLFDLAGGGAAAVHADYLRPAKAASHGDDRVRIVGSKGQIEIHDGRCKLITNGAEEVDITELATVRPTAVELLAAAMGETDAVFSTAQSLYIAKVLLHARDGADQQAWMDIV